MTEKLLTKSLFMNGLQCPKLLWLSERKELPKPSIAEHQKFEQGREFEKYAKKIFSNSIDLKEIKYPENIQKTIKLIDERKTIFEAAFQFEKLYLKADIIEPSKTGWNLYEIKASTEVKKEHIPDLAFQKYVCEKAGLKIEKVFVLHLNKEFIKKGEINPKDLCSIEEVTNEVNQVSKIEENSSKYIEVINKRTLPEFVISMNCNKPRECPLKSECWKLLPKNNVLQLTNWRQYWKLFEEGIEDMKDIPEDITLKPKDEVILQSTLKNKIYLSKEHIKHFLNSLTYPLFHLDFETFDTAVPIYDNSRPWQKIPFQYSLHIQQKDGNIEHFEYLANGKEDPRLELLSTLTEQIQGTGTVIVFNKTFEINVLKKLAEDFPEHKDWIQNVLDRIIDLAVPFQNYYYYNPKQKGKYSIKKVLPAITGKGYSDLEINNGGDASAQYFYTHIKNKDLDNSELRKHLLKYCCLDTEGMVWIINELNKLVQ